MAQTDQMMLREDFQEECLKASRRSRSILQLDRELQQLRQRAGSGPGTSRASALALPLSVARRLYREGLETGGHEVRRAVRDLPEDRELNGLAATIYDAMDQEDWRLFGWVLFKIDGAWAELRTDEASGDDGEAAESEEPTDETAGDEDGDHTGVDGRAPAREDLMKALERYLRVLSRSGRVWVLWEMVEGYLLSLPEFFLPPLAATSAARESGEGEPKASDRYGFLQILCAIALERLPRKKASLERLETSDSLFVREFTRQLADTEMKREYTAGSYAGAEEVAAETELSLMANGLIDARDDPTNCLPAPEEDAPGDEKESEDEAVEETPARWQNVQWWVAAALTPLMLVALWYFLFRPGWHLLRLYRFMTPLLSFSTAGHLPVTACLATLVGLVGFGGQKAATGSEPLIRLRMPVSGATLVVLMGLLVTLSPGWVAERNFAETDVIVGEDGRELRGEITELTVNRIKFRLRKRGGEMTLLRDSFAIREWAGVSDAQARVEYVEIELPWLKRKLDARLNEGKALDFEAMKRKMGRLRDCLAKIERVENMEYDTTDAADRAEALLRQIREERSKLGALMINHNFISTYHRLVGEAIRSIAEDRMVPAAQHFERAWELVEKKGGFNLDKHFRPDARAEALAAARRWCLKLDKDGTPGRSKGRKELLARHKAFTELKANLTRITSEDLAKKANLDRKLERVASILGNLGKAQETIETLEDQFRKYEQLPEEKLEPRRALLAEIEKQLEDRLASTDAGSRPYLEEGMKQLRARLQDAREKLRLQSARNRYESNRKDYENLVRRFVEDPSDAVDDLAVRLEGLRSEVEQHRKEVAGFAEHLTDRRGRWEELTRGFADLEKDLMRMARILADVEQYRGLKGRIETTQIPERGLIEQLVAIRQKLSVWEETEMGVLKQALTDLRNECAALLARARWDRKTGRIRELLRTSRQELDAGHLVSTRQSVFAARGLIGELDAGEVEEREAEGRALTERLDGLSTELDEVIISRRAESGWLQSPFQRRPLPPSPTYRWELVRSALMRDDETVAKRHLDMLQEAEQSAKWQKRVQVAEAELRLREARKDLRDGQIEEAVAAFEDLSTRMSGRPTGRIADLELNRLRRRRLEARATAVRRKLSWGVAALVGMLAVIEIIAVFVRRRRRKRAESAGAYAGTPRTPRDMEAEARKRLTAGETRPGVITEILNEWEAGPETCRACLDYLKREKSISEQEEELKEKARQWLSEALQPRPAETEEGARWRLDLATEAAKMDPEDPQFRLLRGDNAAVLGQHAEAARAYGAALKLGLEDEEAEQVRLKRGRAFVRQGNPESALKALEQCESPEARRWRAIARGLSVRKAEGNVRAEHARLALDVLGTELMCETEQNEVSSQ
jgi:hypothetical protein